jgi:hypothetical protein
MSDLPKSLSPALLTLDAGLAQRRGEDSLKRQKDLAQARAQGERGWRQPINRPLREFDLPEMIS